MVTFFDIECFPNWSGAVFLIDGQEHHFSAPIGRTERWPDQTRAAVERIVVNSSELVGYNSIKYDQPMLVGIIRGLNNSQLHQMSRFIVLTDWPAWKIYKHFHMQHPRWNTIDLVGAQPVPAHKGIPPSLKKLAVRLHHGRLQELPFSPDSEMTTATVETVMEYCANDVAVTKRLYDELEPELELRRDLQNNYDIQAMSLPDSQLGEKIIQKVVGYDDRPEPGMWDRKFRYRLPDGLTFQIPQVMEVARKIQSVDLYEQDDVSPYPDPIHIGEGSYTFGVGGLHSQDDLATHRGDLMLVDAASYYPALMLEYDLGPPHVPDFLDNFRGLFDHRLAAKRAGNKRVADALKIGLNAIYGKLGQGEPYQSSFYAPYARAAVCLTGELLLLELIGRLERAGVRVASANTDGLLIHVAPGYREICEDWATQYRMVLEYTPIKFHFGLNVNDYFQVTGNDEVIHKGKFFGPAGLRRNPDADVCGTAIEQLLLNDVPLVETIASCNDIRQFFLTISVGTPGGAVYQGEDIGKICRWIWAEGGADIRRKSNNGLVSNGASAQLFNNWDGELEPPSTLDRQRYVRYAERRLNKIRRKRK